MSHTASGSFETVLVGVDGRPQDEEALALAQAPSRNPAQRPESRRA